jgi:hypothetical protein
MAASWWRGFRDARGFAPQCLPCSNPETHPSYQVPQDCFHGLKNAQSFELSTVHERGNPTEDNRFSTLPGSAEEPKS